MGLANSLDAGADWMVFCLQSYVGPTVFRGKFCRIPRRRLPNSSAHRGKFLEFRGSPQTPILEYTVPTLAQLHTYNFK